MTQLPNTGKQTNSQIKTKSFYFEAPLSGGLPAVDSYLTDITFKNNSLIIDAYIKYNQDLSAYNVQSVNILDSSANVINSDTFPIVNTVNEYAPASGATPATPLNQVVAAGNQVFVDIGVPIIAVPGNYPLTFTVIIVYLELEF